MAQSRPTFADVVALLMDWLRQRLTANAIEGKHEVVPVPLVTEGKPPAIVDELTPAAIAARTAHLMWVHRGSLTVEVTGPGEGDGGFNPDPAERKHEITLPGGMKVKIDEDCRSADIVTPDGHMESIREEGRALCLTWQCIQGIAIAETLGLEIPEHEERPVDMRRRLAEAVADMILRDVPVRVEGNYVYRYSRRTSDGKTITHEQVTQTPWQDIGGIWMAYRSSGTYSNDAPTLALLHPTMGVLRVPHGPIERALEQRKRMAFANALGIEHEQPVHLPMPRGNAQAARVLRLCREAIAAEPDLTDAKGTPIAPLVNRHLPELMRRHAEAAQSAPAEQLAGIDAELMKGIETVRRAVDEALQVSANHKRDALRVQLAFLEMRHPAEDQSTITTENNDGQ